MAYDERRYFRHFRATRIRDDIKRKCMSANLDTLVDKDEERELLQIKGGFECG